jgi:ABC-type glycerol-3-phosphate transport system permease component
MSTLLAAYALARPPVAGKRLILLGIIAGSAFPPVATVSPLYC